MKTNRSSGIILHITSLPGPFGMGDLGPEAYRFADKLQECGFVYWQLLPLNPVEAGMGYSPYSSTSAFAGNTMLISPELLVREGLLPAAALENLPVFPNEKVNYAAAFNLKEKLLRQAFETFRRKNLLEDAYNIFCRNHQFWLHDFALFTVLHEAHEKASWLEWPAEFRQRNPEALKALEKDSEAEISYIKFTQFLFYKQWQALREYGNQQGLFFFGDLPFYVSFDSAEVWAKPENFKLDADQKPVSVSGVPPDYFSETGQLWGTPIYNWEKLKAQKFDWWIKRLAHNLELFDVARLDHFRAFYDYWEVPATEKTAINGKWQYGPADDFFKTLQLEFPDMPFIAEDLGYVGQGVYDLRDRFNLPGMVVLQYGFSDDIATSVFALHNHRPNMIAYTGTHDNNTTIGWWKEEMKPEDRKRASQYLNETLTEENISLALIKATLMSVAELAIFPLQDLLNLDEKAIMNKPSIAEGNWQWRVTKEQLDSIDEKYWQELLALYGRLPKE
ncbi:4-alpha-glucanotransferase [Adhaeribacter sp. BT258]|uniref:4-alpha-glucanotransferase n=1 Tax=Adhaeribacter terrigena TaxID=2793070 RepID=A0ABS1C0Q9_9BACT|nr:4-alpha-glucanotransferase [Adhaeribacter terrigena]MBK0402988.1 4-alpha-glucanotransferase [Adhaeribacter terrigena]